MRVAHQPPPTRWKDQSIIAPQIIQSHPDVLSLVRELYSRRSEARYLEPYELQSLLWSLGYCESLIPEVELAAAIEVALTYFDPDRGAA